uniref:Uncharacterized protein n=1 Tax=Plectus sambesii TaxID=2011161 RepID=A0A914WR87_9BILA
MRPPGAGAGRIRRVNYGNKARATTAEAPQLRRWSNKAAERLLSHLCERAKIMAVAGVGTPDRRSHVGHVEETRDNRERARRERTIAALNARGHA